MPKSKREFKRLTVGIGPAFKGQIDSNSFPANPSWGKGWVFYSAERQGPKKVLLIYERTSV